MRIPLFHVDAFTKHTFRGNPAAVCFLDSWLDEGQLRKVAAENNLSETSFLVRSEDGYELRWFTPLCEVRLCGHATLAAAHILLNRPGAKAESVRFETRYSGILTARSDKDHLTMDFPAVCLNSCTNPRNALTEALGLPSPGVLLEGDETYVVVVNREEAVRSLRPNFLLLESLHPFVVAVTAPGVDVDFVSRYFAPSYGIPEDPVTGAAHCALAPYWAKRLGKSKLHARQLSERGGELWCEVKGDRVLLTGNAVITMEGVLSI